MDLLDPNKFRTFVKANLCPKRFTEGEVISLWYCIVLTQEKGGQTLDLFVTHVKTKTFVTAVYEWAMNILCVHELCVCVQFKLQFLYDSASPCYPC